MADRPTLVRSPPFDTSKSIIENTLELTELAAIAPDIFTNTRPLWHPPGARGIFGGAVIAQCLSAAQETVPADFWVHSMHCYFVLAGDSQIPVMYYVEHVREGRSFATRTVQARQRGKCIFTTTISFTKEHTGGVSHAVPLPDGIVEPVEMDGDSPFVSHHIDTFNGGSKNPHEKKIRQWIKARGKIIGGHQAHLSALAYMSDSYFIGTVARVHNLSHKKIGMMVSLDHMIYFHEPKRFRADEWLLAEMSSPWSGDGRGVVQQHMFTKDGVLIATCFQEGVVRLKL